MASNAASLEKCRRCRAESISKMGVGFRVCHSYSTRGVAPICGGRPHCLGLRAGDLGERPPE